MVMGISKYTAGMRKCIHVLILSGLLISSCTPDPPSPLEAGQCHEDTDCPGNMPCLHNGPAGSLGSCGCNVDLHCPSWTECAGAGRCRSYTMVCDEQTHECGCSPGRLCPGSLTCSPGRSCDCETDEDCALEGCICKEGLCVRARDDDVLLCELVPEDGPGPGPDAGGDAALPDAGTDLGGEDEGGGTGDGGVSPDADADEEDAADMIGDGVLDAEAASSGQDG